MSGVDWDSLPPETYQTDWAALPPETYQTDWAALPPETFTGGVTPPPLPQNTQQSFDHSLNSQNINGGQESSEPVPFRPNVRAQADTPPPSHQEGALAGGVSGRIEADGSASIGGGGPNTITLENTTNEPMEVAFFKNFGPYEPNYSDAEGIFTLQPGETLDVSMPDDWQGRVQKWNGSTQNYANWAEINFEAPTDLIWFNESDIPGRNSAIKITSDDGQTAGSLDSIMGLASQNMLVKDSSGKDTIIAPQWFTGETNQASVDFLNQHLGTQNAYVLPDDNEAVRMSRSNRLTIQFGDA
jgi:hypothetical protein